MCTANICRSPVAERMIERGFAQRSVPVSVASAGFLEDGREPDSVMATMAAPLGIDTAGHKSRLVSPELVRSSDLVITMERRHARELIVGAPDVGHRVHTLRGLVAAASNSTLPPPPSGALEQWLKLLTEQRSPSDLMGDNAPDNIEDPHGRSKRHYRKCLEQLEPVCADLVLLLTRG